MIDLKAKPFYLSDDDIRWVRSTLSAMTVEEKAGQVLCPMGFSADAGLLHHLVNDIGVGGMMCSHCEGRVKKTLEKLPEVSEAVVSHTAGTAIVIGEALDPAVLKAAVEDQDYTVISVE